MRLPLAALLILSSWITACQIEPAAPVVSGPVDAESGPYRAQHWWIPVAEEPGSTKTIELEAMVYRPPGDGPFPLVEINHGTFSTEEERLTTGIFRRESAWFVSRGYAVLVLLRRGYGRSQGEFQPPRGCMPRAYRDYAYWTAQDEAGAIRYLRQQPFIDARHVIVAGRSAGAFGAFALTQSPPDGVVGVLNFAGGYGARGDGRICGSEESLVASMANLAVGNTVPQLWLYADNDSAFNSQLVDQMFRAYSRRSSATVDLVHLPAWGSDGHAIFGGGAMSVWGPSVASFLAQVAPTPALREAMTADASARVTPTPSTDTPRPPP